MFPDPDTRKSIVLSPPWFAVDFWHDNHYYHVAVLIKHFIQGDVILYRTMPMCPNDIHAIPFNKHEPIYEEMVKRFLLKPDSLMIFSWTPQHNIHFHRIHFEIDGAAIRFNRRAAVDPNEVESSLAIKLSDSPFPD